MSRLPADERIGNADGFVAGDRLDRHARRDIAEHRQLDGAAAGAAGEQFHRAAAIPRPADEALFLQVGEVLVHRRQRRQAEAFADFLEARRIAVLLDELVQVVENLALPLGQWLHRCSATRTPVSPFLRPENAA